MANLRIQRIVCSDPAADDQLKNLRLKLASQAEVVSTRGQELTKKVFGEPLTPVRVVERICADVRARGLSALLYSTRQFDHLSITWDPMVSHTPQGGYNRDLLATCRELGVEEVYRVGGAQAVAAMAYGVDGMPPVDMIVGPGNLFVTLAKRLVFGQVAIDMLAGPTEVIVLADDSANPEYVAADLLAQAEHAPGASLLITWHQPLIDRVAAALSRQVSKLDRGELAADSLERFGALILVRDATEAVASANQLAPDHLHI